MRLVRDLSSGTLAGDGRAERLPSLAQEHVVVRQTSMVAGRGSPCGAADLGSVLWSGMGDVVNA